MYSRNKSTSSLMGLASASDSRLLTSSSSTNINMTSSSDSAVLDLGSSWKHKHKPLTVRMGNSTIQFQKKPLVAAVSVIAMALFLLIYVGFSGKLRHADSIQNHDEDHSHSWDSSYNSTYPLTRPTRTEGGLKYQIALIADLDTDSKVADKENTWRSFLKRGSFTWDDRNSMAQFEWEDELELKSSLALGGRGMELSDLTVFNGHLLSVDDRTGVVYKIVNHPGTKNVKVIPWQILADGNGEEAKGFKCEWMAVKDRHLYVGGLGKEWTTPDGTVLNFNPMYVKRISAEGQVEHLDWHDAYTHMRTAAGIEFPGYMIHEAAAWSDVHSKWFFLPRRASKFKYNDVEDEKHGTNLVISSDDSFAEKQIQVRTVGELQEPSTHGFSSFKFVPGTKDSVIVALKSEEFEGKIASYVMVFKVDGTILYPETLVGNHKYEGIEFV